VRVDRLRPELRHTYIIHSDVVGTLRLDRDKVSL
jgi:hypothetical protein